MLAGPREGGMMRTTLTLEDDVALRRGLRDIETSPRAETSARLIGLDQEDGLEQGALTGVGAGASVPDWQDWDAQRWF
jgi:hypothetical protein